MKWNKKDLLDLESLSAEEMNMILDTAKSFREVLNRPIKKVPILRGKTIVNMFFEPSTRTSASFDMAAKRLMADTVNISPKTSAVQKGETLLDTARNLEAMKIDLVVMRHASSGAPHFLASRIKAGVINAGDGQHAHPTQGLLDMFTIKEKRGGFEGLKVLIVGDVTHSRVARSNINGLLKLGAQVSVCGPSTLIPIGIEQLGVKVYYNLDEAIPQADVINVLRLQLERQKKGLLPSLREYSLHFCLDKERMAKAKGDVTIMHPGPMNRGIEIDPDVADGERSVILDQVTNGVAVRMAVLYLLSGGDAPLAEAIKKEA
ncbi:MAG: aspartate carbamoyltransferase [Candidatus Edwardsbacteria bacterium RIFOXYD12_FULL_50_11]|uniref:Aspartate carbamoyltransferase n=1 Tax=Candidatus Edwardsbacteria bacterium GWF2_54_11 TaxID=1817851 RepID=A0A1F5R432_9BACT|nr:MAG: aspartate carbamoyltransferase [Candidatus Edwardsbacteria bacterium RifOxyC12_full_54_24]OGF08363.1 MAG: aspartate carbamoyltransferase [Candidatus Edwardsbacteria bacterium RifOxyA12_full_54_48]OGF09224.1 MAG: aspartate carbamoyltransferase [Candidatus Edwardsbacteria bacterium GWF2_54_11]OGF11660.1 MAG: aspartate carbamoyltransferase [Candidatus Edwardsbacteria bacterium GWE2_54_12]OGF17687.1 MAG: aspartate carbamoyltransferase [Candidatus Edwardsbacteria bacterium RIFOXYD12_FULL_50_